MIIDAHVHTFPDAIAGKALHKLEVISGLTRVTDGTVSGTAEFMKEQKIDKFINLNIATAPGQQHTINTTAAENNKQYSDMISLGSVHPENPEAVRELYRIKALGIKGIKLHPDYQEFFIDEKRLYPIYEACSLLELPIVFHAGWDCYSPDVVHAVPAASAKVAADFPKLKMVLAHFGGLHLWEDVETYLTGMENVYFDTAMAATYMQSSATAMKLLNRHPIENIFLGSDCPWELPCRSIAFVESLPISDDRKEKILGGNAAAFYGL
ncbi:MAG: amidohydrolase family protein [Clostridia bacterium]